jgi:hypothetical protein
VKHPPYTPSTLIKAVERVTHKTTVNKCEGLMLALERMIRQCRSLPKSKRIDYKNKWAYVAFEIGRRKYGRGLGRKFRGIVKKKKR